MKKIARAAILVVLFFSLFVTVRAEAGKKGVMRVNSGSAIPSLGLVIDANYDSRLDELTPGYKMVSVAIANQSVNILQLSLEKDVWKVKLAGSRKYHKAIHNLRTTDPKAWQAMPQRVRELTAYPVFLPIGGSMVVDLFLPDTLDLDLLTEVSVRFKAIGKQIDVVVRD